MKKIIMILMALGLTAAVSMAAISYVTGDSSSSQLGALTGSETVSGFAAGSGNYVVVGVAMKTNGNEDNTPVTGVTYGGSGMTYIGMSHADNDSWDVYTYLYGIASTSASGDVVASWDISNDGDHDGIAIAASSWSGVGGYTTVSPGTPYISSQTGDGFSDSITTTGTGSLVIGVFGLGGPADGLSTNATVRVENLSNTKSAIALMSQDAATAGTYASDYEWSGVNARRSSAISVELIAVPEPATVGMLGLGAIVALLVRRMRA